MSRDRRAALAAETLRILESGRYTDARGETVVIADAIARCVEGTRDYSEDAVERLRSDAGRQSDTGTTEFEVANETTLAGLTALLAEDDSPVAVLNFASAKNPGGGFLGGSQAQEESLARSSALYASLMRAPEFYARHRASSSLLYSDAMIHSPGCPVFREDDGALLAVPQRAGFITCAAPNAGAIAANRSGEYPRIESTFVRRAEGVLALAAAHGYRRLVLGAWGCGVFRNDPAMVAGVFARHLRAGVWAGCFGRVRFSVLDTSPDSATLAAFREAFDSH